MEELEFCEVKHGFKEPVQLRDGKCWFCEEVKHKEENRKQRASPEGRLIKIGDKFGRHSTYKVSDFPQDLTVNFLEARERKNINILSFNESGRVISLVMRVLGKKPDANAD